METKQQIQSAYDGGSGSRCNRHIRNNPYNAETQPKQHAAWEKGFSDTDAELSLNQSVTEHIDGEQQSLDTFVNVLELRADGFAKWWRESGSDPLVQDEADWDDDYTAWLDEVERRL